MENDSDMSFEWDEEVGIAQSTHHQLLINWESGRSPLSLDIGATERGYPLQEPDSRSHDNNYSQHMR